MVRDGYYEAFLHTQVGESTARLRLENGMISGRTNRGAELEGTYQLDSARGVVNFSMIGHLPPNFRSVTGLVTGDEGRKIEFRGEASATQIHNRFSLGFAGRAIDIALRYKGPLSEPEPV
jgi:hypothetical protein